MITRRDFCGGAASLAAIGCVAADSRHPACTWRKGHFQIHQIYTGVCESYFLVYPDGTSMLLDCGDSSPRTFEADRFGDLSLPILPNEDRRAGAWIARYVERVNPHGRNVDYLFLSHFHGDHSGSIAHRAGIRTDVLPNGEPYWLSGFALAAETLHFRRAIDRGWPDYDDPLPCPRDEKWMGGSLALMKKVYRHLSARDGLKVEKFRVGARDQLAPLHDRAPCGAFSVFNLCGNGKVAMKDGSVVDCYASEHAKHDTCVYNENAMSLGMVFSYGKFRFFTAGDFTASDGRKGVYQGRKRNIEDILAQACGPVSVAKANHHAAWACPESLVAALRPRVWLSAVWWQMQCDRRTMARLASRDAYSGERLILPGVMCPQRCRSDAGEAYLADVPEAVRTPSHVVVDVAPGGETYTVTCTDAATESGAVKKRWTFNA